MTESRPRPAVSRPLIERTCTLHTEQVQSTYQRYFRAAMDHLHYYSTVLQRWAAQGHDGIDQLVTQDMEALDGWLLASQTTLIGRRDTLLAQRAESGLTTLPRYSAPLAVTVSVSSPRAGRLLEVFLLADQVIQLADGLWMAERLDDRQRAGLLLDVRHALHRPCVETVSLGAKARALVWFYQQPDTETLRALADELRAGRLAWGTHAWIYQQRVGLQFPDALTRLPDAVEPAEQLAAWHRAGWLENPARPLAEMGDRVLVVFNQEVSTALLAAAGINRKQRQQLAAVQRRQLLAVVQSAPVPAVGAVDQNAEPLVLASERAD
jgi:hypothetical protein